MSINQLDQRLRNASLSPPYKVAKRAVHYLKFSIIPRRRNPRTKINDKSADMFDRVINSLSADTASRVNSTKIVPTKFHLWFRCIQLLIYALVWIGLPLFSRKTNNCTMHRKSNRSEQMHVKCSDTSSWPLITPSSGCAKAQSQDYQCRAKRLRNYFQNWRSNERLSEKSMSSRPSFSLEIK